MGEGQKAQLRVGFDRGIKLEFRGAKVTSVAGLSVYRELEDAFNLTSCRSPRRSADGEQYAAHDDVAVATVHLQPVGAAKKISMM